MKVVAKYPDLASAEVARSALEAAGIPAWIPDGNLAGLDWRMATALGGVRLQVDDQHAEAAAELLAARPEPGPADSPAADEVCPFCDSTRIGRDDRRRLLMASLLFPPLVLVALALILMQQGRTRCRDCGRVWRHRPPGGA